MADNPAPIETVPLGQRLWLIFATYLSRANGQPHIPPEFLMAKPDDASRRR